MYCTLGKKNFRTQNIVNNMSVANSVKTGGKNHYIEFYTEYWDYNKKKIIPSKIVYIIDSNLVNSLRKREKIESKSNS